MKIRQKPTHRTDSRGVVMVLDGIRYIEKHPGADLTYCYGCHRWWDDAVVTGWTPTPSGRCPFEDMHKVETT